MTEPIRRSIRSQAAARFVVALVALEVPWWIACERFRLSAPGVLLACVALPWAAMLWAWLLALPRRAPVALGAALLACDALADAWFPVSAQFVLAPWQLARLGALAMAAWLASRARHDRSARVVRGASLLLVAAIVLALALHVRRGYEDDTHSADAALVLGFALDPSGHPRPGLVARVDRAAALYRSGLVRRVVLSGGAPVAGVREADAMRALALARGVPDEAIVREARSTSTIENFAFSAPILRSIGARRVLVVTEPYHMPRSLLLARRYGVEAWGAPALRATGTRGASLLFVREIVPTETVRVGNVLGVR